MSTARTSAAGSNGGGDYVIAFSTAPELRISPSPIKAHTVTVSSNEAMSSLFLAVIEAAEESDLQLAVSGNHCDRRGHTVEVFPLDTTVLTLRQHGALNEAPSRSK